MTAQEIVDFWGGRDKVAEVLGVTTAAVHNWFVRGAVPRGVQFEAAQKSGHVLIVDEQYQSRPRSA